MARTQAKVLASIWTDPDWLALPERSKLLYLLVLSQPRLTLAGSIDVMPGRWARMLSPDTTEADTEAAADRLVRSGFVVLDDDELVVRSFTRHDLAIGAVNVNLVKGFWSAWAGIRSPMLRKVVIDNLPDAIWDREGVKRPDQAEQLRSEPQLELRLEPESEPSVDLLPASFFHHPPTVPTEVAGPPEPVQPEPLTDDEIDQQANRAVNLVCRQRAARQPGVTNPGAYARSIGENFDPAERAELRALIASGVPTEEAAAKVADPMHGFDAFGGPPATDPAAIQAAADKAKEAERATKAKLAEITAAPEVRMSREQIRALRSVPDPSTQEVAQ